MLPLLILIAVLWSARMVSARPSSLPVARRRWEKSQERMKGQVIEGEVVWRHTYRHTAHGLKHSVGISGANGGLRISPSLGRKLWARKWTAAYYTATLTATYILFRFPIMLPLVNTWNNAAVTQQWSGDGNWTLGHKPAAGEDIVYDNTSTDNCTIDENTNPLASFSMNAGYTGIVSLGAFTLNVNNAADSNDLTGVQGTIDLGAGIANVSRHWDTSSVTFVVIRGLSQVNLVGTGNLKTRDYTTYVFYSLTLGAPGKTTTLLADTSTYGTLTVGTGIYTSVGLHYLRNVASPLVNNGTLNVNILYAPAANVAIVSTTYGKNLYCRPNAGFTCTLLGNIIVGENLYVFPPGAGTAILNTAGFSVTVTRDISLGSAGTQHGILIAGASAISIGRDLLINTTGSYITATTASITVSRHMDNNSTSALMDLGLSTFIFNGAVAQTIAMNGDSFYDVRFTAAGQKNFTESFGSHDVRATVSVTMQVQAGITWTVVAGAAIYADVGFILTLRSSAAGNLWTMTALGSCNATRVNVMDSDARTGNAIWAADGTCVDAGNNFNWDFWGYIELGIVVSGDGRRNFGIV